MERQKLLHAWKSFWRQHKLLSFFLLFTFAFCFLFWLQYAKKFADPDSFYHAKIIWLMQQKIIAGQLPIFKQFPWLYYTVLRTGYIDHHFLYHLLSIPCLAFAQFFLKFPLFSNLKITDSYKALMGFKLATIGWAASFITVFYWLLRKLKIKGAAFYSILLLVINPFVFRLSLGKATATSLIFLFIGTYFIVRKKTWPLFILSFFYVWLYGGWPLMLILVSVYAVANALIERHTPTTPLVGGSPMAKGVKGVKNFLILLFSKSNIKLLSATIGGLLTGIIINPYFPKNIIFYYHQIYKIAIINYKNILNVGTEWYPYNFLELLSASSPIFLLAIPAVVLFIGNLFHFFKKNVETKHTSSLREKILLFSFILTIIFLVLTLRSRRNVEYLFPFLALFVASSFDLAIKNFYHPKNWQTIVNHLAEKWLITGILCGFFAITIPYIVVRDTYSAKIELTKNFSWNKWESASIWLKNNTKKNEIIFHNDWDDWPFLFFHNDKNYYLVGLDPTFMYNFDKELYTDWSDATLGKNKIPLNILLSEKFDSKYIVLDKEHSALEGQILTDGNFTEVFNDKETKIYELK
jgi:hypothetical protein